LLNGPDARHAPGHTFFSSTEWDILGAESVHNESYARLTGCGLCPVTTLLDSRLTRVPADLHGRPGDEIENMGDRIG
jgi:hypothetical protein